MIWLSVNFDFFMQNLLFEKILLQTATNLRGDYPSSTKNREGRRDPEMRQTKKGNQWYFGMKAHIGVDSKTKLIHSVVATSGNVHDKHPIPQLLHGHENRVYGDSAYASQKALIRQAAPRAKDFTNQKASRHKALTEREREKNRTKSQVRAKVEHAFLVIKRVFGFARVCYRGLRKNDHGIEPHRAKSTDSPQIFRH